MRSRPPTWSYCIASSAATPTTSGCSAPPRRTHGALLVFSHPRHNLVARLVVGAENLGFRLARREFRVFAHPPAAMLAVLGEHGLEAVFAERGFAWEARGLSR